MLAFTCSTSLSSACRHSPAAVARLPRQTHRLAAVRPRASAVEQNSAGQGEGLRYEHILLAIMDSNPALSSSSRAALQTAANLAGANHSKLTVCFVDQEGARLNGQRLQLVQGEMAKRELEVDYVEEVVEGSVGQGSVAVGEVADSLAADLVVISSSAVHEKRADANLLAEFVPCPVLLLP